MFHYFSPYCECSHLALIQLIAFVSNLQKWTANFELLQYCLKGESSRWLLWLISWESCIIGSCSNSTEKVWSLTTTRTDDSFLLNSLLNKSFISSVFSNSLSTFLSTFFTTPLTLTAIFSTQYRRRSTSSFLKLLFLWLSV